LKRKAPVANSGVFDLGPLLSDAVMLMSLNERITRNACELRHADPPCLETSSPDIRAPVKIELRTGIVRQLSTRNVR
jgi:hypothetical protein